MKQATVERSHLGGVQKLYRFDNGYGASVVLFSGSYGSSYGLWELAVIKYHSEHVDAFSLDYDTEITDDVIGDLNDSEVDALLERIEALPADAEVDSQ